jgi:hypothetical protein
VIVVIHDLTIGHLDPASIPERRKTVIKALEMDVVNRLLDELGGTDAEGNTTLGGSRIRFENGYVVVTWLGGWTNRVSEEFALRMQRETGCLIVDLGHRCVIGPEQLQGLGGQAGEAHMGQEVIGR